ncbi:MAG: hypothetical protein ABIO05_01615, partial [Ferruginibacter sp.]
IYNNYPHKITVPQQPILVLSEHEVDEVKAFALQHQLQNFKKVILIECGPDSFTSALNPLSARDMAETLVNENPGIACILSSNKKIHTPTPQIIDGSVLNFRANAALTHYCHLFIGCSSGISWITTTQSAKPLQKIIIINPADYYTSSMVHDHEWSGLPTTDIIEMHTQNNVLTLVAEATQLILYGNFVAAKNKYHKHFKLQNYKYVYHQTKEWLSRKDFAAPAKAWQRTSQRNGFTLSSLLNLIKGYIKFPFSSLEKKKTIRPKR